MEGELQAVESHQQMENVMPEDGKKRVYINGVLVLSELPFVELGALIELQNPLSNNCQWGTR